MTREVFKEANELCFTQMIQLGSYILFSFECAYTLKQICGDYSEEVTPVPIPNTEVKLLCADDTRWETARESKTLPLIYFFEKVYIIILICDSHSFLRDICYNKG